MKTANDLQRDVLAELAWEPSLDASAIGVGAHAGVVTLTGHVGSYAEKRTAEKAAKRVAGVRGVADELEVRVLPAAQRDDTDIAEAAVLTLQGSALLRGDRIRATVDHGWVTLEGDVDWRFEKKRAEKLVSSLTGVRGVTNRIAVRPQVAPEAVEEKIRTAFKRSAEVDADHVHVEALGSKVILRGRVRSWGEYEQAEWGAWSAPGVSQVENHLRVEEESTAPR